MNVQDALLGVGIRVRPNRSGLRGSAPGARLEGGLGANLLPAAFGAYFEGLGPSRLHSGIVESGFGAGLMARRAMDLVRFPSLSLSFRVFQAALSSRSSSNLPLEIREVEVLWGVVPILLGM